MRPLNPLAEEGQGDLDDQALLARVRAGDRDALETVVRRHQPWIYNLAVRMLAHPADAQDATQEILIKAITRLGSFEGRSRFRTWLYRIVVHHVLNMKRGRAERTLNFGDYGRALDGTPDLDLPDPTTVPADLRFLVDALVTLDAQCADIFRQHPFAEPQDLVPALRALIESAEFRRATDLL